MISIIISSADAGLLQQVSSNVAETIGVPYEIIAIDNSKGERGICAVYNQGATEAKYDILCFMHEDINIKTNNWGLILVNIFKNNPDVGLVGVAGGDYKTIAPSGWNPTGIKAAHINLLQGFKYNKKEAFHYYENPGAQSLAQVSCVDGVWFCSSKKIAEDIRFDEENFTGFHVYDLDFSFAVGLKHNIAVTFEILIEHFSEGNYDSGWMLETIKLHKKWNKHFPINLKPISNKESLRAEKETFKFFIDQLILFKLPVSIAYEGLYLNNRMLKFNPKLFFKLHSTIIKKYLKH